MIKLRGYEAKYITKDNTVEGGIMWESDENLHFVHPITENINDLKNAPFEYKDLMLGSPFEIDGQTIFEEDIILFQTTGTQGVVKQDKHQGWVIQTEKGHKYSLIDSVESLKYDKNYLKIISNTFLNNDTNIDETNLISNDMKNNTINYFIEEILEQDKFFINFVDTSDIELSFDFIFSNSKTAKKYAKLIINSNELNFIILRNMFNSIYTEKEVLVLK
jgi:hypothetical protein